MRKSTFLERSLAAVLGGVIGGFLTFFIVFFFWTTHWLIWTPPVIGVLAGFWGRDRGIIRFVKAIDYVPW